MAWKRKKESNESKVTNNSSLLLSDYPVCGKCGIMHVLVVRRHASVEGRGKFI